MDSKYTMVTCQGCGLKKQEIKDPKHPYLLSSAVCWNLYTRILEKEYSDPEYMSIHRLTVDTYCAQHPGEENRKSTQSVNVHLVGLHLTLDRELQPAFTRKIIGTIANSMKEDIKWIEPTFPIGVLNVDDVVKAKTAKEHQIIVTQWAQNVWSAWKHAHEKVIALADNAIELVR